MADAEPLDDDAAAQLGLAGHAAPHGKVVEVVDAMGFHRAPVSWVVPAARSPRGPGGLTAFTCAFSCANGYANGCANGSANGCRID